jgi:hypothetical protein
MSGINIVCLGVGIIIDSIRGAISAFMVLTSFDWRKDVSENRRT